MKAMSKSIIGLLVSAAILAVLLTGCSDEPDPIPSNGTDSSTTTSSEQGVNPEPTHAPTSAVTNTAAPEAATPTPAALPTATATPTATPTPAAPEAATPTATPTPAAPEAARPTPAALPTATATPADTPTAAAPKTRSAGEFASVSAGGKTHLRGEGRWLC